MKNNNSESGFFKPRVFLALTLCSAGALLAMLGFAAPTPAKPLAAQAVVPVISPPVRDLPTINQFTTWSDSRLGDTERLLKGRQNSNPLMHDPVVQTTIAPTVGMPPVGVSFEGMDIAAGCGGCLPPDTNGAVGPNHYVQMVNEAFAVYNKTTGAVIKAPTKINQLWSATTTQPECKAQNSGDPIVIYDQLADRWLLSQFVASASPNYAECIAVSTSPDPAGTYYLYEFDESTSVFHDYPHIGIWPDAYYMSSNEFPDGAETNSGAGAFAFERAQMLAGQPARFVWFDEAAIASGGYVPGGQNPTNLDGRTLPPAGAPNYFIETDIPPLTPQPATSAVMCIWKFHVDWTDPTQSTFGTGSTAPVAMGGGLFKGNGGQPEFIIPVANFVPAQCVYGQGPNCVPEKIVAGVQPATLDTLGDRIMFRAAYRNFGDHESLVVHHTVVTAADPPTGATRTGLRWYEVRNLSTTPTIYQQSTFAPLDPTNPIWRWMGSPAMDHVGNIAIGYSASGPNYFPSLHYAGRLATDPLGELTQGEAVLFQGLGIQGYPLNRWGDYSDLTVDPTDDCTFWYTNEYNGPNPLGDVLPVDWHTRIGSFKFPQCVSTPVQLTSVVSRKTHGGAGDFNIDLLPPSSKIECRNGQPNPGDYTIVFTFAVPVTFATADCGGTPATTSSSGNTVTVNCTGLTNAQNVQITVHGVSASGFSTSDQGATMRLLIGDTNEDTFVNSADIGQTKSRSGQVVGSSNFRSDVTVDGNLNSGDIGLVKSKSGTALP